MTDVGGRALLDALPLAVLVAGSDGVLASNAAGRARFGWPSQDTRPLHDLVRAPDGGRLDLLDRGDTPGWHAAQALDTAGRWHQVQVASSTHETGCVVVVLPLEAQGEDARGLQVLMAEATEAVLVVGSDGAIRYASPASERALGRSPDALMGIAPVDLVHPEDLSEIVAVIAGELGLPRAPDAVECRVEDSRGAWRWVEMTVTNLLADDRVRGLVLYVRDIHERKTAERSLVHQALHDALTGLANRALVLDRLGVALDRLTRRPDASVAVLYLDLDGFKHINDDLGHAAGDRILVATARRLSGSVRPADTVGRLGGDEFVLICPDVDAEAAEGVLRRVRAAFAEPFRLEGRILPVRPSIGLALADADDDATSLLARADAAMYAQKRARRRWTGDDAPQR